MRYRPTQPPRPGRRPRARAAPNRGRRRAGPSPHRGRYPAQMTTPDASPPPADQPNPAPQPGQHLEATPQPAHVDLVWRAPWRPDEPDEVDRSLTS